MRACSLFLLLPLLAACQGLVPFGVREQAPLIAARAVVIVRHGDINVAEKFTRSSEVALTQRGQRRAEELVAALRDAGVTRIVTSEALRTQQTAAKLAAALNITPESVGDHARGGRGAEAQRVVQFLQTTAKPTDVILLVHHHSVIPQIMGALGYPREKAIENETEFDRVYVLLPDRKTGHYQLLRLRYGDKPAP